MDPTNALPAIVPVTSRQPDARCGHGMVTQARIRSRGRFRGYPSPALVPANHVEVTNSIRNLRRLAGRALPAQPATYERPEFLVPSLAALGLSILLLLTQRWPLAMFFAPTFVIACRYYELARFPTVRRSRLAFLLILTCAAACALWALTHRAGGFEQPLTLGLAGASLAIALHLFTTQRRLTKGQITQSLLHTVDEDAPYWACGGLLALLPVLLLLGCLTGLLWWRSPLILLWGLAAIGVLAAQLHSHAWFPRLAVAWLTIWLGIEIHGAFTPGSDSSDDAIVSACVVTLILSIATYLLQSPRVRRTFRRSAAAPSETPSALTVNARSPQPMRAVPSVRSTG